jgi:hypothetical protein
MNASKLLLTASIFLLAASLARADERNQVGTRGADHAREWEKPRHLPYPLPHPRPQRPGAAHVLDLSTLPAVIDEPGSYVLNRDWDVSVADVTSVHSVVDVQADDVVIDFRGFEVTYNNEGAGVVIQGANVTVRGGRLIGYIMSTPISSSGAQTTVENMYIQTFDEAPRFQGSGAVLRETTLKSRFGVSMGSGSVAERNHLECSQFCIALGSSSQAVDNRIDCSLEYCLIIRGDGNLVVGNRLFAQETQGGMQIVGNGNVLRNNTILMETPPESLFEIKGSANIIDGNIGAGSVSGDATTGARAALGIYFTVDGNFYGNNRLAAVVLLAPNGTVQTDWGGNVAF